MDLSIEQDTISNALKENVEKKNEREKWGKQRIINELDE
jgi:hypothetical protein